MADQIEEIRKEIEKITEEIKKLEEIKAIKDSFDASSDPENIKAAEDALAVVMSIADRIPEIKREIEQESIAEVQQEQLKKLEDTVFNIDTVTPKLFEILKEAGAKTDFVDSVKTVQMQSKFTKYETMLKEIIKKLKPYETITLLDDTKPQIQRATEAFNLLIELGKLASEYKNILAQIIKDPGVVNTYYTKKYNDIKPTTAHTYQFGTLRENPGSLRKDRTSGRVKKPDDTYGFYYDAPSISPLPKVGSTPKADKINKERAHNPIGTPPHDLKKEKMWPKQIEIAGKTAESLLDAENKARLSTPDTTEIEALIAANTIITDIRQPQHKKMAEILAALIQHFIDNDLDRELKANMTGGADPEDAIVRFLRLSVASELAEFIIEKHVKKLAELQARLTDLATRTQTPPPAPPTQVEQKQETSSRNTYLRPLWSIIKYQIAETNSYDEKLFEMCQDLRLPLTAAFAIFLSTSKSDTVHLIKRYSPSYTTTAANSIMYLKKMSAEQKLKKNWKIVDHNQMQFLVYQSNIRF